MKFSNGFKIAYWIGLIAVLTWFLSMRVADALEAKATAVDGLVFAIWAALLLAPLFGEVEFLGVKLKHEVDKAKEEIKKEIGSLRNEISTAIDVRTNISPQIYFPAPPADAQLPVIEQQIKKAVDEAMEKRQLPRIRATATATVRDADDDTGFLMWVRHDIEKELRRIANERALISDSPRPLAGFQLTRALVQAGIIETALEQAIREVYAVCSRAVHAEDPTDAQVAFVRDVGPELIETLKAIH